MAIWAPPRIRDFCPESGSGEYRTAIQNQNQNQNQNQFEIIGNSSTVPIPEFQYCPDPVNEFSGRFPENSRAAREFSSGWRKSTDANSRPCARARHARDRVCTGIPYDSDHPESGTCTYLPSSRTLYENPGHAEPVSRRSVHRNPVAF